MTFQLQAYKAKSINYTGANRNWQVQFMDLLISAANTDTALDISSDTAGSLGTFWTAATGDSTYGTLANNALTCVRDIVAIANSLQNVYSETLLGLSKVGAGGLMSFTSAAIATGTSVSATVTGLLATDTVLAVTQKTANASTVVPVAFGTPTADTLPLTYASANGGSGTVEVLVYRGAAATPSTGQYGLSVTGHLPSITFVSGSAPTSYIVTMQWLLQDGVFGINQDAGAAF